MLASLFATLSNAREAEKNRFRKLLSHVGDKVHVVALRSEISSTNRMFQISNNNNNNTNSSRSTSRNRQATSNINNSRADGEDPPSSSSSTDFPPRINSEPTSAFPSDDGTSPSQPSQDQNQIQNQQEQVAGAPPVVAVGARRRATRARRRRQSQIRSASEIDSLRQQVQSQLRREDEEEYDFVDEDEVAGGAADGDEGRGQEQGQHEREMRRARRGNTNNNNNRIVDEASDSVDQDDYFDDDPDQEDQENRYDDDDDDDESDMDVALRARKFELKGILAFVDGKNIVLFDTCPPGSREYRNKAPALLPEHRKLLNLVPVSCTIKIENIVSITEAVDDDDDDDDDDHESDDDNDDDDDGTSDSTRNAPDEATCDVPKINNGQETSSSLSRRRHRTHCRRRHHHRHRRHCHENRHNNVDSDDLTVAEQQRQLEQKEESKRSANLMRLLKTNMSGDILCQALALRFVWERVCLEEQHDRDEERGGRSAIRKSSLPSTSFLYHGHDRHNYDNNNNNNNSNNNGSGDRNSFPIQSRTTAVVASAASTSGANANNQQHHQQQQPPQPVRVTSATNGSDRVVGTSPHHVVVPVNQEARRHGDIAREHQHQGSARQGSTPSALRNQIQTQASTRSRNDGNDDDDDVDVRVVGRTRGVAGTWNDLMDAAASESDDTGDDSDDDWLYAVNPNAPAPAAATTTVNPRSNSAATTTIAAMSRTNLADCHLLQRSAPSRNMSIVNAANNGVTFRQSNDQINGEPNYVQLLQPRFAQLQQFVGEQLVRMKLATLETEVPATFQVLEHAGRKSNGDFGFDLCVEQAKQLRKLNEQVVDGSTATGGSTGSTWASLFGMASAASHNRHVNFFDIDEGAALRDFLRGRFGAPGRRSDGGGAGGGAGDGDDDAAMRELVRRMRLDYMTNSSFYFGADRQLYQIRVAVWTCMMIVFAIATSLLYWKSIRNFVFSEWVEHRFLVDLSVLLFLPGTSSLVVALGILASITMVFTRKSNVLPLFSRYKLLRFLVSLSCVISLVTIGLKWRAADDVTGVDGVVASTAKRDNSTMCYFQLKYNCSGSIEPCDRSAFFFGNVTQSCPRDCGYDRSVFIPQFGDNSSLWWAPTRGCAPFVQDLVHEELLFSLIVTCALVVLNVFWGITEATCFARFNRHA